MKKGFTLIELLAVIVILAIILVISVPQINKIINDAKNKSYEADAEMIEKAAGYYMSRNESNYDKYKEYYIPVTDLEAYLKITKEEMNDEYVVVKTTDNGTSYYYTGRDKNPYLDNSTLKEVVERDTSHIVNNIKVNGVTVNKVIGTKTEKNNIKNWVWYSGQLWQILETNDTYVKMITANSVTTIAYGPSSTWSTSWVRKWLNLIGSETNQDGIYYNNLSRKDMLLDGNFCLDEPSNVTEETFTIGGETRSKVTGFTSINTCNIIATDKVGIMTFEDYVYSLNGTDPILGALGNNYIDEDELSWTMTKYTIGGGTNKIWHTYYQNPSHIEHSWDVTNTLGKGVRPVIYISANTKVIYNSNNNYGTLANPYRLVGEQVLNDGDYLNGITIGSYIYISEVNNTYITPTEYVTSRLSYIYDKTKVRYRVIGINSNGTIKVERADVLRSLPGSIAVNSGIYTPYYYKQNTCDNAVGVYTDCENHNYYKPHEGNGVYSYTESENIGYYLNNADNSYYNWLSNNVKNNIVSANWNLSIGAYGADYATSLFNTTYTGTYPSRTNDGIIESKIGLPTWGDMFSGNDLNIPIWYINRWPGSTYNVSCLYYTGVAGGTTTSNTWFAIRPIFNLKSNIKIISGDGTPAIPYIINI